MGDFFSLGGIVRLVLIPRALGDLTTEVVVDSLSALSLPIRNDLTAICSDRTNMSCGICGLLDDGFVFELDGMRIS